MTSYDIEQRIPIFFTNKIEKQKTECKRFRKLCAGFTLTDAAMATSTARPGVIVEPMLVDNLAMRMVLNPQRFDVILADNMFGDILSDLGGALVGSIGLLGSASLNADGFGLYEAIHGTAPDIAGKGIANPLGTLAACILMLQQWGEVGAAQRIMAAQNRILAKGYRTADLSPQSSELFVNTEILVELLLEELSTVQHSELGVFHEPCG